MIDGELACILLSCLVVYIIIKLFNNFVVSFVVSFVVKRKTTVIEKNPKWITSRIQEKYYGFNDIDFILAECPLGGLPKFNMSKDKERIELWIPNDILIRDLESLAKIALLGKIKIRYGIYFPEKPIYWLSILCYMLDGGDIKQESVTWEEAHGKKI